jgi:exonuclease SbcC
MWRVERIEIENFRSYRGRHVILSGDVNILWGRVGAGKTSVLYAIEYALFGRQLEVKERVARLVDLIHSGADEMRIALTLRSGSSTLCIERQLARGGEKLIVRHGGEELRGGEAESRLLELIGADEDVYERLVYISHRTLEDFIYGTARKRSTSVDRLFGIDIVDGVVRVIAAFERALIERAENLRRRLSAYEKYKEVIRKYGGYAGAVSRLSELDKEIAALRERERELTVMLDELAQRRSAHLSRLRESESVLVEYYKAKSELEALEAVTGGEDATASTFEKIREAIKEAVEEYEHALGRELLDKLAKSQDLEALSAAMMEAHDALARLLRDMEAQVLELRKFHEQYAAKARRLESEIADMEARLRRLERGHQRFRELQKQYGQLESAKAALLECKRRFEELERGLALFSALRTIAHYITETGLERCPVCGSALSKDAIEALAKSVDEKFGGMIREAERYKERARELERAIEEMEALNAEVLEYLSVRSRLEELRAERDETVRRAVQAEKALRELERKGERLKMLLSRIDKRALLDAVARYSRAARIRELRRRLRELEDALRRAGLTGEAIEIDMRWREAIESLERVTSRLAELYRERALLEDVTKNVGGEAEELRKELDAALYAYSKLEDIKSKLMLVKLRARERLLEAAKSKLNEVFLSLYRYGDIVKVGADLEGRRGYYDFHAIAPNGEQYGIAKLSDGQRLSIALALALALRFISNVQLGFLIFDDPIPYIDVNIRKAFIELVRGLAEQYQVFVATQSEELARALRAIMPRSKLFAVVKNGSSEVREE